MRSVLGLSLTVGLWFGAGSGRADDAAARAVLDRAVQAHGGADNLAKARLFSRKAQGVISFFDKDVPFTSVEVLDLPERARGAVELTVGGQKLQVTVVLNGDRVWRVTGGATVELTLTKEEHKEEIRERQEEAHFWWVTTLAPLQDKAFELSALPEMPVKDKPAAGVKVARKGRGDVRLYFDKRTGLLVKAERRGKEAGLTVDKEYFFTDHKNFDGVQMPTKYVELTNGKKLADVTVTAYKVLSKAEEGTFEKP